MTIREHVCVRYKEVFGESPSLVSRAPGRLEILGNHTDYNEGIALSCAVDKSTYLAAGPSGSNRCRIYNCSFDCTVEFAIDQIGSPVAGAWENYVLGVIVELQKRGQSISGFNGVLSSDLPMSSGMSSSAALEVAAAMALGNLNAIDLPPVEWARIGQASENLYVGANTGLLDQLSSIMGKENALVRIDFRSLDVETHAVPVGAAIVVANSGVKHDLTQDYNERRRRCEEAAAVMKVPFLRDADLADLERAQHKMPVLTYRRARHILEENLRVEQAVQALRLNDLVAIGRLFQESHTSSRENFENSCPELDVLVETGCSLPGCYGARLSGGGFGGISIHLVDRDAAEEFSKRLKTAFHLRYGRDLDTMICAIGQGAEIYV